MNHFNKIAFLLLFLWSNLAIGQTMETLTLQSAEKTTFQIEKATDGSYKFLNTVGNIHFKAMETEKGAFYTIHADQMYKTYNSGKPDLPVISKLMEIPAGAEIHVKVLSYDEEIIDLNEYGLDHPIIPAQESRSKAKDEKEYDFRMDRKLYQTDRYFHVEPVTLEDRGIMRYRRIGRLEVSPFQYNPVKNTLRILNNLKFEVRFSGTDQQKAEKLATKYKNPFYAGYLADQIINSSSISGSKELPDQSPITYVIVSDPMFETQLQPFIQWKRMKGFHVVEAYTDDIGSTTGEIKSFLQDLYENPDPTPPSFVLFVGDVEQVPAWDGTTESHVTDLYYCEYTDDKLPEVYYGRFSAQNEDQLQPQVDKTLYYEKYQMADASYLQNHVLVAGLDGNYASTHGNGAIRYAHDYYSNENNGITPLTYLYEDAENSTVMASTDSDASSSIISKISAGVGLANYTAHCNSNGWGDPSFTISDVGGLTNENMYGIWIGNCCLSVKFDNSECFGEAALRAENKGAIGDIGGSNNTLWDEDYYWGVGYTTSVTAHPTYEETGLGAYDRLFHTHDEEPADWYITQGQIQVAGNLAVEASTSSNKEYYWEIYHLMGDPSLMPYLGEPSALSVSASASTLTLGMSSLTVNTEPYAYVALSQNGTLLDAKMAGSSGEVQLAFSALTSTEDAKLVVTAQNKIPSMVTYSVIPLDEPYIALDSIAHNEVSGDNDQNPDYGEELSMDVRLKNISRSHDAFFVVDSLASDDRYIEILDTLESFGTIDSNQTAFIANAFSYQISDSIPDQHEAKFTMFLSAKDSVDQVYNWSSDFKVKLNAPDLRVGDMMIADTGGNNNGILDAGENGLIKLVIHNEGHDSISQVYGKLSLTATNGYLHLVTDSCGMVSIGESKTDTLVFQVSASADAPLEDPNTLDIEVKGAANKQYQAQASKELLIGEIPRIKISDGGNASVCTGYFYDSGGSNAEYSNEELHQITIYPATPASMLKVTFTSFDVEENSSGGCYDELTVYDGTSELATEIGTYCNEAPPTSITASNEEGALTFAFDSDISVTGIGWVAEISCIHLDSLIFTVMDGSDSLSGAQVKVGQVSKTTNASGQAFFLLENGSYDYTVTKNGYTKTQGTVNLNGTIKKDVSLQTAYYDLTFVVTDKETSDVLEAEIRFKDQVVNTTNGKYTFTDLTYETDVAYTVTPVSIEYIQEESTLDVNATKNVEVKLDPVKYGLFLTIVDENEKALQGAEVQMADSKETTNTEGKASFQLRKGKYHCLVSKEGYTSHSDSINLSDTTEMTHQLLKYFDVTFDITDSISAEGIAEAAISIDTFSLTTNSNGTAYVTIPFGEYQYVIQADGYPDYSDDIQIDNTMTEEVVMLAIANGIMSMAEAGIQVYPVPAEETLFVEFPGFTEHFEIRMQDAMGRVIYKKVFNDMQRCTVDLSEDLSGVHILEILIDGNKYTQKIIIK